LSPGGTGEESAEVGAGNDIDRGEGTNAMQYEELAERNMEQTQRT